MARIRQSRPDSGIVFQVQILKPLYVVPFRVQGLGPETALVHGIGEKAVPRRARI